MDGDRESLPPLWPLAPRTRCTPDTPQTRLTSRPPHTPLAPQAPQTPQTPHMPHMPQAPQTPQTPHLPDTPYLLHTREAGRRRVLALGAALALPALSGCAIRPVPGWEDRLRGDTVALLGEVHDNAEHHRLRAALLRRACAAGWRPAIVMEQFDTDRQADLERSRAARPRDAQHLIAQAAPERSGWHWPYYEPLIQVALDHDLPLIAGNLPRAAAARIVREGYEAVLGAERVRALGLAAPPDPHWQAAQEREIDAGHCGALPRSLWAGMARAQFARDATMAWLVRQNATSGAVLLAGNGHVRRDLGVPRWLIAPPLARVLSVGYLEVGDGAAPGQFDAVVVAPPAQRADPCREFEPRRGSD